MLFIVLPKGNFLVSVKGTEWLRRESQRGKRFSVDQSHGSGSEVANKFTLMNNQKRQNQLFILIPVDPLLQHHLLWVFPQQARVPIQPVYGGHSG